ncbi:MAG: Asp23/Gls24 family envelope stress response protein [Christensenellales bacterium]|jgi:uncharacterized alkaline shock family protein YloU
MSEDKKIQAGAGVHQEKNAIGKITFANDVVATIAGLAAIEIPGVAGMSGGIVDGLVSLVGRKNLTKGVKVEVGTEEAAIDLYMVINYGVAVHTVAYNVQENVKRAVETMTGLKVVEVNVYVQGVNVEREPKEREIKEIEPPRVK